MLEQISLAFAGGLLSFVSPCVLPLVPAYISYVSGTSMASLVGERSRGEDARVLVRSLLFVAGFSLVFVGLGASATALGRLLAGRMLLLRKLAGLVLVVFGLHTAGILRIGWLDYERRLTVRTHGAGHLQALLLGMAFALGWTPCIGPILGGILAMATTQESVGTGVLLLWAYALGLGIPFIATAVATRWCLGFFDRLKRHFRCVEIVSGLLLVTVGILIYMGWLGRLSGILVRLFPFLSRVG